MPLVQIQECGCKGLGLFSRQEIRAGDFVGEYMGEIVTENEYHMRRLVRYYRACRISCTHAMLSGCIYDYYLLFIIYYCEQYSAITTRSTGT